MRPIHDAKLGKFLGNLFRHPETATHDLWDAGAMKTWIVKIASLYVFDVLVLLVIGAVLPKVQIGWAALWGGVILTAATLWVKPAIGSLFRRVAANRGRSLSTAARKVVEYAIVFVVALVVWALVVLLTNVSVQGLVWAWIVPPLLLLVAWAIYDAIDDALHKRAGAVYDRAAAGIGRDREPAEPVDPRRQSAVDAGRREMADGLTDEQRKLLDDLS